jgi:endonuclease YncB( thermonuclease family)
VFLAAFLPVFLALAPVAGSATDPSALRTPAVPLATLVAVAPAGAQLESPNAVLPGKVIRVADGDSIQVMLQSGRMKVRLASIDAPERDQPGGREATAALAARVKGRQVSLEVVDQSDGYGRLVAVVWLGDENVNEWLVRQGYAWAFRGRYLHDRQLCVVERAAREAALGLWSRTERNYAPWEWRHVRPGQYDRLKDYERETVEECAGAAPAGQPPRCLIKGNISRSGRIYHLPGSPGYERTVIDASRGERWFCSADEARAAGWRAPRD